jgi:hypothetical protein
MKEMDHTAYPKSLRAKPVESLHYIIQDCKAALKAYPEGRNAGYYSDEINYCVNELHRRKVQIVA